MAENKNENQQSQQIMNTPRYDKYIEGWDASKLNNADVNISQYGDDSSAKNYDNPDLWGGENQKYTGENTLNSHVSYNKDATIEGLDPNYKYGQAAQMANSEDANYIARRNDEIASALYNAGKVSEEDVANFLSTQKGWDYSTGNERQNTIKSVWKRLGQIAEQNKNNEPAQPETTNTPDDTSKEALNNMESDLNQSTAGKLYGKVTADENTAINTLEDENSVYKAMNASRIQAVKDLQVASADALAAAIVSNAMSSDSQAMRDLMQYDPTKYQEIQTAVKKLRGQMNINTITSGEGDFTTSATGGKATIANEKVDFATSNSTSNNTADILKSVDSSLNSNINATSASETMASIESDMATLQNRLKNLKKEASTVFKGDVPQYIVNAYVANRTAEIQDQLSILENRYNAAYSRYQTEREQTKRNAEYNLKKEELQLKKDASALEDYATRQGIAIDWYKAMGSSTTTTTTSGKTVQTTSLTREEISTSIDSLVDACVNGELGNAQCAAGIQKYYLPTLGVDLGSLSAYSAKQGICTDLAGDYTPQKGDLVVMSSPTKPENGHIGIVVGVDGDTLKYLDWNGSLDANGNGTEKASIRTTKLSNSKIYGYYNPTHGQNQGSEGSEGDGYFNPNIAEAYSNYLRGKYSANSGKQAEGVANSYGLTLEEFRNQANAWKASQNNSQDVTARLEAVAKLMNTAGSNRTGRILSDYSLPQLMSSGYADFDAAYNYVRDNISFDKLLELKRGGATFGALSDNELRAIGNAASSLRKDMSNEEFQNQLAIIYNGLLKGIGENSMTVPQIHDAYNTKLYTPSSIASSKQGNTNRNSGQTTQGNTNRGTQTSMTAAEKAKSLQGF